MLFSSDPDTSQLSEMDLRGGLGVRVTDYPPSALYLDL